MLEPGKYCKIRVLYDPDLFVEPSLLRERQLSIIIADKGPDVSVLKSPDIAKYGE